MKFRIEEDLQYCPRCNDEYRAGIAQCAACSTQLISGREMLELSRRKNGGAPREITPEDELVDLIKGPVINIKNVQSMLRREGFPSITAGGDSSSCGKGCCGSEVKLQVRMADIREIMAIMAREHMQSTGLIDHGGYIDSVYDQAAGAATCPACGCSFATTSNTCPDCGLSF